MKKRLIIIISSVVVVLVAAGIIVGVSLSNRPTPPTPPTPPGPNEPTEELFVPRGLELNGTVLSWDMVDNATEYVVSVGEATFNATECSIDLNGKAKERDVLSVKAVAEGYIDSKKSIEKIYIVEINQEEVNNMSSAVLDYVAKMSGGTIDEITEMFGDTLNNIAKKLYKEGLVANDIENIVNTVDDVITSIENFEPTDETKVSEYVEVITNQISKVVDLELPTYAATLAIKEVALFALENMSSSSGAAQPLSNSYDPYEAIVDYLENMSNRDVEKIAIVLDSLKEIYVALEVKLPNIFSEIDKIEIGFDGVEDWDDIFALAENVMKIKDDLISSILVGMPTMEEFTEVASIFASIYDAIAPEYIKDNNPYELCLVAYQEMYAMLHQVISFIGEIDTELFLELKPYLVDICTIIENDIYELMEYSEEHSTFNVAGVIVYYALEKSGYSEEEIEEYMNNVNDFAEIVTDNPEEILSVLMVKSQEVLTDELKNADFTVITEDPLIQKIISILKSDNVEVALKDFLEKDIKVNSFVSFKEGKNINDLVSELLQINFEDVINFFNSHTDGFTSSEFISALGLDDVAVVNIEGMFAAIIKLANVETINLLNDLFKLDSVEKLEALLSEYFNIKIDIETSLKEILEAVLDYYGINLEFADVVNNLVKALELDKVYSDLENIYKVIETKATEFNASYTPLIPYKEMPSTEDLKEYVIKNLTYSIFGDSSEDAVKDLEVIYDILEKIVLENEIEGIVDRVVDSISNLEFDFAKYLSDSTYEQKINNDIINLTSSLLTEYTNTYNYVMGLEGDLTNVAIKVENFASKYFMEELDIASEIDYLFEELEMYELTKDMKQNLEQEISSFVNNNLKDLVSELVDMFANLTILGDDIYSNYLMNEARINELSVYIMECVLETINVYGVSPFDQVAVVKPLPSYYEYNDPKEYLYELAGEEIKEFVALLEVVITPSDEEIFDKLNENIYNIYNILGIEESYNYTDLYNDLCELLDEIGSYGEIDMTAPITIEYWHANGGALTNVLNDIKDEFEKKYPNITVELVSMGGYDYLRDYIIKELVYGTNNLPTVAQTYPDHVGSYLSFDALVDLDTYLWDEEYGMSYDEQLEFIEGFWNEGTVYDNYGTRYALPFNKSTEVMYYNAAVFEEYGWEVPTTWDEVTAVYNKWKETDDYATKARRYGEDKLYGLVYDSAANLFITLHEQGGVTYTSLDEYGNGVFNAFGDNEYDMSQSKVLANWLLNLKENHVLATPYALDLDYSSDALNEGLCLMSIGSSAGASYYSSDITEVAPVPQVDVDDAKVIQQGTNISLFKCEDKAEELAGWLWMQHMVSYESALTWAMNTSYFPIRKDVLNSDEYQNYLNSNDSLKVKALKAGSLQQDWFFTNVAFAGSTEARFAAEQVVNYLFYYGFNVDDTYRYIYEDIER